MKRSSYTVRVRKIQVQDYEISPEEAEKICKQFLESKFNYHFGEDTITDTGYVQRETEQCGGSHCWFEKDRIRRATPTDHAMQTLIENWRKDANPSTP